MIMYILQNNFFKMKKPRSGKRILITGGAGFIGSHLVPFLSKKGYDISVVDLKEKPANFVSSINYIQGDARDKKLMNSCLRGIDICFHLAAVFGGSKIINDYPAEILKSNSELLISVFEAGVENKVKRIIFPSSGLVYNENLTIPVKENDLYNYPPTHNPYGIAKLLGENFCRAYWHEKKLAYTIVRMFNVYGSGDIHEHVIPNFVKNIINGVPVSISGDGSGTRVFTFIDDIVDGLWIAATSEDAKNEVFNLSSEEEVRLIDLCRMIWKISGEKGELNVDYRKIIGYTPDRRSVSSEKIKRVLGWEAKTSLERGLNEVILWMRTLAK